MAHRVLRAVRAEVRPAATGIYEGGLKWAIGVKIASEAGTQRIGIETRREKISAVIEATTEFNRLVQDMYNDWCTKNGIVADPSIPAKARKIISLRERGLYIDAEAELSAIKEPYREFINKVLNSDVVLEAYRKILRARRL